MVGDWRDRFKRYDPRRRLETQPSSGDQQTPWGFRWGPFEVMRVSAVQRGKGQTRVVSIVTDAGRLLEAYVSGTGRSIRVWIDHKEMLRPEKDGRVRCHPEKWICSVCGGCHTLLKGAWYHSCEGRPVNEGGMPKWEMRR